MATTDTKLLVTFRGGIKDLLRNPLHQVITLVIPSVARKDLVEIITTLIVKSLGIVMKDALSTMGIHLALKAVRTRELFLQL